jgi:micrococcal nuclease
MEFKRVPLWAYGASVCLIAVLSNFPHGAEAAETYRGTVTYVTDGDTAKVVTNHGAFSVRFTGIDAPEVKHNRNESDQPWGQQSKEALTRKIEGHTVELSCDGKSYDRRVCTVILGGLNINEWMVQTGNAWAYDKYDKSGRMQRLENQAKSQRLGVWSLPERQQIEPSIWRRAIK